MDPIFLPNLRARWGDLLTTLPVHSVMRGFGQLAFLAAGQAISLSGLPAKYYSTQLTKNGFFDVQVSERPYLQRPIS